MKIKSLQSALKANGLLVKLKNIVNGSENLTESQLKNVMAGSDDESGCAIFVGPPCAICVGPPPQTSEEQTSQDHTTT
jgi:hypothetical protein